MWSGTIVEYFTKSTSDQNWPGDGGSPGTPGAPPAGTAWWGADSNLGFFGFEAVTDGTSNTALFSEKLLGATNASPMPFNNGANARRGLYDVPTLPVAGNSGSEDMTMQALRLCQSVPSTQQARGESWISGFSWAIGYPWNWMNQCYSHYNTPNKLSCTNVAAEGAQSASPWGGQAELITASSNHPGGVNLCFTDGSVKFVKDTVTPKIWWALGTKNGEEVVSSDSY